MLLITDILRWTETDLTPWQRDAARRLFQKQSNLSVDDFDDFYVLLKAAHGLPNTSNLKPIPLSVDHIPQSNTNVQTIILNSIHSLNNVNRIPNNQTLSFSPEGITVIYGPNGSGKSGYFRVMKHACRARDQAEPVHTDATDPTSQTKIPEATFDISVNSIQKQVKWCRDKTPPEELSNIAVFDSHCARVYLTAEQNIAYLPYGLDVVEALANVVLPELTSKLANELEYIKIDLEPFNHLINETKVGALIKGLNHNTDLNLLSNLSTISEKESTRTIELEKALSELDPKAKAKEIRLLCQRIANLCSRMDSASEKINDVAIDTIKNQYQLVNATADAEKLAAKKFAANDKLLPGTGEKVWKTLFEAARKFSIEAAYPNNEFPYIKEGALCPLCQQLLTDGADRMKRFNNFIQENVTKEAEDQRKLLKQLCENINANSISIGFDDTLSAEVATINEKLVDKIHRFEAEVILRQKWLLNAMDKNVWNDIPCLNPEPRLELVGVVNKLNNSAIGYENAANETQRQALSKELAELKARKELSKSIKAINSIVETMKLRKMLESCNQDLNTRSISAKSKEFSSSIVSKELKAALNNEFKALGIGHIQTKFLTRNIKGETKYRLVLDLPYNTNIEEILSQGEQRAIALGSFLAELSIAGHKNGIVFDDPVSSLDHWHRHNVANRLVKEAQQRQVIVLTHDTVFLSELQTAISNIPVSNKICHLEYLKDIPGHVHDGLPWDHQNYKERIDTLEKTRKQFEKMPWPVHPNEEQNQKMAHQYSFLRATIERVIEDVVFNGVVQRYRDWVKVKDLKKVIGFEEPECLEIERLHKRCCDVTEAHDKSPGKNAPLPNAMELANDINALISLITQIRAKQNIVK
jgi:energy-coupling factor transporter ATP-binding protein EcfA2